MAEGRGGKHFKRVDDVPDSGVADQPTDARSEQPASTSPEQSTTAYSEQPATTHSEQPAAVQPKQPTQPVAPVTPAPSSSSFNDLPDMPMDWHPDTGAHRHHRHHHKRRRIVITVVCIIAALVVALGISSYAFYRSAKTVTSDASAMVSKADDFSSALESGDTSSLQETASEIQSLSDAMASETSSPLWSVAEYLPVVGSDISKVRVLTSVADNLSENVLVPTAQKLSGVSMGTLFSDGKINVEALSSVCDALTQVQPEIQKETERVDSLGDANLSQVNEPLQKVRSTMDALNSTATGLSKVAPSLPTMLGANGTRTYLVVAQNNSEIRSTGGFPGSRMTVTVEDGSIQLGDFSAVGSHFSNNSIPLTDEERTVVSDIMQTGAAFAPGDVNAVPSFPRAAQLMEWCWQEQNSQQVDGVIAVDPVFLQSLLKLTGGVTTSDGTVVDGSNAAEILLNKTYYLDPALQDPFFSEVAGLAMKKVMSSLGSVSMTDLASTLSEGTSGGRLLLYMNDANEESAIEALGADGEVNQDPTTPVAGFYVYDKTGSKLDWYLDLRSTVSAPTLNTDGSKTYTVTVTLGNTTTLEQMQSELPSYIVGVTPEVHHYSMITSFMAMAPAGGSISDFTVSADEVNAQQEASLYGNDVWAGYVNIYPSSTATFTYKVTTSPEATSDLTVWTTPTGRSFQ